MLTKLSENFKKIDFVGATVKPTFNSHVRVSSLVGACFSLMIVTVALIGFVLLGKEIVDKKKPRFTQTFSPLDEAAIPLKDFHFALYARGPSALYIQFDKKFMRSVKFYGIFTTIRGNLTDSLKVNRFMVPMVPCSIESFREDFLANYTENKENLNLYACPDWKNSEIPADEPKVLKNEFSTFGSSSFVIFFVRCDELKDPGCADYLDKELGSFSVGVWTENSLLNISEYENPVTTSTLSSSTTVSPFFFTRNVLSININELVTDSGWILANESSQIYYTKGNVEYQISPYNPINKTLYNAVIQVPRQLNKVSRDYAKLQEIIANVGGFMKGIMMFSVTVMDGFSHFILKSRIKSVFGEWEKNNKIEKKPASDNFINVNKAINQSGAEIKPKLFVTGAGPETMVMQNYSIKDYIKYLIGLFCKKDSPEDLSVYLKFIDFKHVFSEIIRTKEELEELKNTVMTSLTN